MNYSFPRLLLLFVFVSFFYADVNAQTRNGLVITKDENGVIREKGQMVRDRREGEWNFYNAQGKLEQQTNYAGGKKNGIELHFLQGDTISLGHYKNDVQVGEWKKWDDNFRLIKLQHYDDEGHPAGTNFQWESDGSLKSYSVITPDRKETDYEYNHGRIVKIAHYDHSKLDGRMIIYNVNNKSATDSIQEIKEYKEGREHGESIEYANGKIIHKANYCNGFLCGASTWYDEEGRITLSRTYDPSGRTDGVEKQYENGKLVAENSYVNGSRNGKQAAYDPSGVVLMESYFTMGRLDSSFSYYANAAHSLKEKIMRAQESLLPTYFDTTYYENGNLKTTFTWQTPGTTLEGSYTIYYPTGKPQTLKTYKSNATNGIYKEWNTKGTLILQAVCRNDGLADSIRVWKEDGTEIDSESADFDRYVFRAMQPGMSFNGKIPADMKLPLDPNFDELPPSSRMEYFKADSLSTFENSAVYTFAEVMPVFPGDGFAAFLSRNIKYPVLEKEMGMQGTVYVSFIITSRGTVAGVKCVKEVLGATGLTKESMRVIRMMPRWTPGMNNGKPVNVRMVQPIRFKLQ
jgi:protein TonB